MFFFFISTDFLNLCWTFPHSYILHACKTSSMWSMSSSDASFRNNLAIFFHSRSSFWAPGHLNLGGNVSLDSSFGKGCLEGSLCVETLLLNDFAIWCARVFPAWIFKAALPMVVQSTRSLLNAANLFSIISTLCLKLLCILLTALVRPFLLAILNTCHTFWLHFLSEIIVKSSLNTLSNNHTTALYGLKLFLPHKLVYYSLIQAHSKVQNTATSTQVFCHRVPKIATTVAPSRILASFYNLICLAFTIYNAFFSAFWSFNFVPASPIKLFW